MTAIPSVTKNGRAKNLNHCRNCNSTIKTYKAMKQIMGKFNVGDKVRYKSKNGPWTGPFFEYRIMNGDVGVVDGEGYYEGHVLVKFGVTDYVPIDELELIETSDTKHEFLQRLQSLLREFDAKIDFGGNDKGLGFIFSIGKDKVFIPYAVWTGEIDQYGFLEPKIEPITADNIMEDFDKE